MISSGDNRRRYRRVKNKVKIKLSKTSSEAYVNGYTRDLSLGGACIELEDFIPSFSVVNVILGSEHKNVKVEGRILWIKEIKNDESNEILYYLSGLQFLNLNTEEQKLIVKELMEKR